VNLRHATSRTCRQSAGRVVRAVVSSRAKQTRLIVHRWWRPEYGHQLLSEPVRLYLDRARRGRIASNVWRSRRMLRLLQLRCHPRSAASDNMTPHAFSIVPITRSLIVIFHHCV